SNSDNLLRMAPSNLLLSSRTYVPPVDLQAEATVVWTPEAENRMEQVPAAFRGITRTAICRYAMERGHSIISSSIIDEAVAEVMPAHAARAMGVEPRKSPAAENSPSPSREEGRAGGAAAENSPSPLRGEGRGGGAAEQQTWICRRCGRSARGSRPAACPVCEGTQFQAVDKAAIAAAARQEGPMLEEEAFDG